MKKIIFFIIMGCWTTFVFSEEINTGYYKLSIRKEKNIKPEQEYNVYIESVNDNLFMYSSTGNRFKFIYNGQNSIKSKSEFGPKVVVFEGKIVSKNHIEGKHILTSVNTNKKEELFFL